LAQGNHYFEPVPGASGFHTFPHVEVGLEYRGADVRIRTHPDAGWTVERLAIQEFATYPIGWSFWNGLRFERVKENVYTIAGVPQFQGILEFRIWMLVTMPVGGGQFNETWVSDEWYVITVWPEGHGISYDPAIAPETNEGCVVRPGRSQKMVLLLSLCVVAALRTMYARERR
jgi:hypothetical protein